MVSAKRNLWVSKSIFISFQDVDCSNVDVDKPNNGPTAAALTSASNSTLNGAEYEYNEHNGTLDFDDSDGHNGTEEEHEESPFDNLVIFRFKEFTFCPRFTQPLRRLTNCQTNINLESLEMKMEGSEKSWNLYFTCQLRYNWPQLQIINHVAVK